MDIIFGIKGKILIAELLGEVDHHGAAKARADIDETMEGYGSNDLIFDFSKVTFMDSSGIGMIMGRYRAMGMRGNCIRVTGVSVYIEKLLHLSGVYKFVEICREA